jgi:hypothetical protein
MKGSDRGNRFDAGSLNAYVETAQWNKYMLINKYKHIEQIYAYKNVKKNWALVADSCNPSYLGGWNLEDHSSRPAQ